MPKPWSMTHCCPLAAPDTTSSLRGVASTQLSSGSTGILAVDPSESTSIAAAGSPSAGPSAPAGFQLQASYNNVDSDKEPIVESPPGPEVAGIAAATFDKETIIKPPPGLEPPPWRKSVKLVPARGAHDALPMPTFVISLDTEDGRGRRNGMNLFQNPKYEVIEGVLPEKVPRHVVDHWYYGRMSTARNKALQGAFSAHWKVWMGIAAGGDKGALVLEDDCVQYRGYPRLKEYKTDGITLLGGCFKGYSAWGLCERSYMSSLQFLRVLAPLQVGIRPLPQQAGEGAKKRKGGNGQQASRQVTVMRWSMCVAYVVPPGFAKRLCADVDQCRKKNLKSPDVWLAHYTKYFLWPPAFGDQGLRSQCFTDSCEGGCDLYCSSDMRRVADKAGRALPEVGAPQVDVQNWQIRELCESRKQGGAV